jgi:hypothetical protein
MTCGTAGIVDGKFGIDVSTFLRFGALVRSPTVARLHALKLGTSAFFIPDDLKPNRRVEPSEPLMRSWLLLATADVEQLLRICVKLLQEAGQRFPERN